ncbi:MAG: M23 family peptidase, partial [Flavobacterium sp.]
MAKVKYYYDSENLAYRKIKTKKRHKFAYIVLFLVASALFGFICFVALLNTPYFDTPKDRLMSRQIENLKLNYDVLNKRIDELNTVTASIEDRDNNLYRTYFNISAIPTEDRKSNTKDPNRYAKLQGYD